MTGQQNKYWWLLYLFSFCSTDSLYKTPDRCWGWTYDISLHYGLSCPRQASHKHNGQQRNDPTCARGWPAMWIQPGRQRQVCQWLFLPPSYPFTIVNDLALKNQKSVNLSNPKIRIWSKGQTCSYSGISLTEWYLATLSFQLASEFTNNAMHFVFKCKSYFKD